MHFLVCIMKKYVKPRLASSILLKKKNKNEKVTIPCIFCLGKPPGSFANKKRIDVNVAHVL